MDSERFNELVDKIRLKHNIKHGFTGESQTIQNKSVDVSVLRKKLGLTQNEFEKILGVSELTIREWEKGVVKPEKPILLLLRIAQKWPIAFIDSLGDYRP